ncbi:lysine N(6)-hydroxylase/L-ornithine N(5)-oxygenase family protein [Streptomonospora nanhaiensis]|uniref:L-lysine N6-monooxygenase MbtG n=1 Tax=Streptomonospora nanhaiensis TaxID=1323731 RepID=A0A853BH25_9ACTN|nr:SidA/IucD/PvdA family monooxygenase [Streptomonospora nanhaiensis]MBX9388540.1 lysine N(6)-hydroxylase/L-ornithine N(5)-oxygenase family protein [Streptomonospora nanhaiensis]NYI93921.1 L-ornithine N5-oxygenase [Streptomonospora nanhaiensis]
MTSTPQPPPVHDLVGIGFGPSNVALAIGLLEQRRRAAADPAVPALTGVFHERQPEFGWHRGMLLDDATMQVSFLKDLVTTRNPASDFGFLSYLHSVGRLHDFINHKTLFPLRAEFHAYLAWCAGRVADQVRYSSEVVGVEPVRDSAGRISQLDVIARAPDGSRHRSRGRNIVFAPGLTPRLPEGARLSERVWHNEYLLQSLERIGPGARPRGFVVVGAGQSAAEVVEHLYRRFPGAQVHAVFSRFGYSPSDDSPFANRIFDPDAVDAFYGASAETKAGIMDYHRNTNYSVVDPDLIDTLYQAAYQDKVKGTERLRFHNTSRVAGVSEGPDGVTVTVEDLASGKQTPVAADYLVYATGYRPGDPRDLLGDLAEHVVCDAGGRCAVQRDYRLATTDEITCGIYLQGGTEHTHGISSSLLSNVAVRVGEILDAISARTAEPAGTAESAAPTGAPAEAAAR